MNHALEVRAVPQSGSILIRLLGRPRWILTHWGKKKGFPCPGEPDCPDHARPILKGYVAAQQWDQSRSAWLPVVFEVTESCLEVIGLDDLVGSTWSLSRQNFRRKVRQVAGEKVTHYPSVPMEFDVVPVVERLYRTHAILWDVSPQLFVRSTAEITPGDAPPAQRTEKELPASKAQVRSFLESLPSRQIARNGNVADQEGNRDG